MKRRDFITLLGGATAAWPLAAHAQSPKMLRVGYSGMMTREAPHYAAFEKRMAELGYQEGRNFTFEYIQTPSIAGYELTYRELAARNVDILLAAGNEPACGRRGPPRAQRRSFSSRWILIRSKRVMWPAYRALAAIPPASL